MSVFENVLNLCSITVWITPLLLFMGYHHEKCFTIPLRFAFMFLVIDLPTEGKGCSYANLCLSSVDTNQTIYTATAALLCLFFSQNQTSLTYS